MDIYCYSPSGDGPEGGAARPAVIGVYEGKELAPGHTSVRISLPVRFPVWRFTKDPTWAVSTRNLPLSGHTGDGSG